MENNKKVTALKWVLRIAAIVQAGYWGVSHICFPGWYLRSIGMTSLAENPGPTLLFLHEIGVLTLGVAFATWLASRDPVRNFPIIAMLYFIALGSIATSLYHISARQAGQGEWLTVALIGLQLLAVTLLFPWKALKCSSPGQQ